MRIPGYDVLRYREAARASQRGFDRLHRKLDQRDKRIAELEGFIEDRQLTGQLVSQRNLTRVARYLEWKQRQDDAWFQPAKSK